MDKIIITNEAGFQDVEARIKSDGAENLHIIADFDRTLTKAFVDGKPVPSITSILRDHNYLTPDYPDRAKALYAHYGKIERDPSIPKATKKTIMIEWWTKHFELLKECRLNKNDVEKAMMSGVVQFREGVEDFLKTLQKNNIPLVIMSASGLGGEAIEKFFSNNRLLFTNLHIIGNQFVWDKDGYATGIKQPIITGENKDETLLQNFPVFQIIKGKKNVILLGDNFGDTGMIEGFDYNNLIKIGFLNTDISEISISHFKQHYDAIVLEDGSFDFVNKILKNILE